MPSAMPTVPPQVNDAPASAPTAGYGDGPRPGITVVMAAYNAEAFLSAAIDSILAQTRSDFELVVVDDASLDGTWGILQQYARSDGRIRLRRNATNVRQVTSLNFGIMQARAPYVAIMDADDIADPDRLEHQSSYLDAHPEVGVVGSLYDAFESDPSVRRPSLARPDSSWRDGNVVMHHATMMVRRDLYALHGLYDPSYDDAGDYEIQSRFAHGGVRFHVLDEALLHYRVHPGSMTGRRRRQQEGAALRISMRTLLRYRRPLTARGFAVTARHLAVYLYMWSGLGRFLPAALLKRLWPAR